jgi:deoxyhypusine synthase
MASKNTTNDGQTIPPTASGAVLKPSEPVADDMQQVRGIEFNDHAGKLMTINDLIDGMSNMGFQASAVAEATRIIDEMVIEINPTKEHTQVELIFQ